MSDLVRNPEDKFSHNEAKLIHTLLSPPLQSVYQTAPVLVPHFLALVAVFSVWPLSLSSLTAESSVPPTSHILTASPSGLLDLL